MIVFNDGLEDIIGNESQQSPNDPVNHPSHYCTGKYECLDVMEEVFGTERVKDFCLLNAFKYIYRCYGKDNTTQDIEKAGFYINRWIKLNKKEKTE